MPKLSSHLPLLALAFAIPAAAQAQNYADLPPLAPMSQAELRTLPTDCSGSKHSGVADKTS